MAKTIVGVYEDRQKALEVYQALKSSGFGGENVETINVEEDEVDAGADRVQVDGDLIQSLIDRGVPKDEAATYAEGVRRGDHMIIVRTEDLRESAAVEAMADGDDEVDSESHRELETWSLASKPARQLEEKRAEEMRATPTPLRESTAEPNPQRGAITDAEPIGVDEARAESEGMGRHDGTAPVEHDRQIVGSVSYREAEMRHDDATPNAGSSADLASPPSNPTSSSRMAEVQENEAAAAVTQAHLEASTHCADDEPVSSTGGTQDSNADGEPSFDRLVGGFRSHYDNQISPRDAESSFDDYMVAYKVGHRYALDGYYRNRGFESASPRMREEVESAHGEGAWDRFKDAIRHSYEKVKETLS